jgi:translation initiation factor IF-3
MPLSQALQRAKERDVDLVEVAPTANPPVCRLLDYGKFRYEQAKKERQAHKRQKATEVSQIRLRPKTGAHDIEAKINIARRLLGKGNKVKLLVIFRGREIVHSQLGRELLERVAKSLEDVGRVEKPPMADGRNVSLFLSPAAKKPKGEK